VVNFTEMLNKSRIHGLWDLYMDEQVDGADSQEVEMAHREQT
jgi:hypothetical protein